MSKNGLLVIGLGISGLSAALLAKRVGREVYVTEKYRNINNEERFARLEKEQIDFEVGNSGRFFDLCGMAVVSPGIDPSGAYIKKVESLMEVISEIEFAYRCMKNPFIIGVTGTNGKSTTVSLIQQILADQGIDSVLTGNIGIALSDKADKCHEVYVCELSSYQLERIRYFRPNAALFTNLTPDHLNRYGGSLEKYAEAKMNMFRNMKSDEIAVFNGDDPELDKRSADVHCVVKKFSRKARPANGYYSDGLNIYRTEFDKTEKVIGVESLGLVGAHNIENILGALCIVDDMIVSSKGLRRTLAEFKGIEHRLEFVIEHQGVKIYNDSKGTNVDSTEKALESFPGKKIVLILGGDDAKKSDFTMIMPLIKSNCRSVVLIGETSERLRSQLGKEGIVNTIARNMSDAVRICLEKACSGDVILLSPAAASFDMFDSFEHRGKVFKDEVIRATKELP